MFRIAGRGAAVTLRYPVCRLRRRSAKMIKPAERIPAVAIIQGLPIIVPAVPRRPAPISNTGTPQQSSATITKLERGQQNTQREYQPGAFAALSGCGHGDSFHRFAAQTNRRARRNKSRSPHHGRSTKREGQGPAGSSRLVWDEDQVHKGSQRGRLTGTGTASQAPHSRRVLSS